MPARAHHQRGQATVEHVGLVVLVATMLALVTTLMVRSLHPPDRVPEVVASLADRLAAPLADGASPSAPAPPPAWEPPAPAPVSGFGAAEWRPGPVSAEPLEPFWVALDLHRHELFPVRRWIGSAKRAIAERLPALGKGCIDGVMDQFSLDAVGRATGQGRLVGPLPSVGDDISGLARGRGLGGVLDRTPAGGLVKALGKARKVVGVCLAGAAGGLLG
jgi:hypothetical protein